MYLRTPKRYTAKGTRRGCGSFINLRWLWLYLVAPIVLIPALLVWDYREPIGHGIENILQNVQHNLNVPTPTPTLSPIGYGQSLRNALQSGQMDNASSALRGLTQVLPNDA